MAAVVVGLITLTTPLWAAPNHVVDGYNLVYVLAWPLAIGGLVLTLGGSLIVALASRAAPEAAEMPARTRPSTAS